MAEAVDRAFEQAEEVARDAGDRGVPLRLIGGQAVRLLCPDFPPRTRKPPRFTMPAALIKTSIPFAPVVTRLMRMPPNLKELVRSANGVTYWAADAKARRELGYSPRDMDTGLRQTLAALKIDGRTAT